MSNYAAVIAPLAISGSRKADGSANDSGRVFFYQLGTTTPVAVYADAAATIPVSAPITLDNGGRISAADYPDGIFITQPIRLYIEASDATVVSDTDYVPATAGAVGVSNAGFTDSTADAVYTKAFASFGGQDWLYKESSGATSRTVQAKFGEVWVSVKDFGAVGNGIAIDTTPIQAAFNRVKALGGGTVYFPPGTYKIDAAIVLDSATGVSVVGNGSQATIITSTHATANAFTFSSCTNLRLQDFRVSHSATSTGAAISLTSCGSAKVIRVGTANDAGDGVFRYGVSATSCSGLTVYEGTWTAILADAAARAIFASSCSALRVFGGTWSATAGYSAEFDGTTVAQVFSSAMPVVRFAATLTGVGFGFFGCSISSLSVATATIPVIRIFGGSLQASATSGATGAAQTPSLIAGEEVILTAASGGAGVVTVNSPAVLPPTGTDAANLYWDFVFKNAAGGAVTWTLNAVFVVNAAIPTTDGHTISVRFRWDRTTSKLREVSRADTVT